MEIYFDKLTRPERVICLVLDDSVIARERRSGYNGKKSTDQLVCVQAFIYTGFMP